MSQHDLILVQTSFAHQKHAEKLAAELIEKGLAACTQISGPTLSTYKWKGTVVHEDEYILNMKTTSTRYSKLAEFIDKNHPYEIPEIVATKATAVNPAYLAWVKQQCAE